MMHSIRIAKLLLALLLGVASASLSAAESTGQPNVLVIITDEHNFRTLGCYRERMAKDQAEMWGSGVVVETPNIDRIAKEGLVCTRAYATSPVCSPCRAAMITGRYPQNTGVPGNDLPLDRSVSTLADRLGAAGYRTSFVGKWHLGGTGKPGWQPKIDGGFQHTKYMFNRGHWKRFSLDGDVPAVAEDDHGKPTYNLGDADETTFATDWLTDRALEVMTAPTATQPFLTVLSYPDPHGPNTVRAPYDHRFDNLRFSAPRTYDTGIPAPKWLGSVKKHPVFRGADMSRYFGMVQCIDDNIGRILARLEDSGQLENTLILLTSDHGDLCYEHDRQNKGNPYEGSARVPLILRYPGHIQPSQTFAQPVGTVDITPTLVGLLKLPADPSDEGRDLARDLLDVSVTESLAEAPVTFLRNAGTKPQWVAAIDERYKLILSVDDVPWLFDAEQDPDELLNFYRRPGTDGVAERLALALKRYSVEMRDPHFSDPNIAASLAKIVDK